MAFHPGKSRPAALGGLGPNGFYVEAGAGVIELVRTNDLVMISVIEGLLTQARVAFFIADQHMSATEGSLGFLPRRIMVDADEANRARRVLQEAGLAAELRHG
jgi:hypothetical protein